MECPLAHDMPPIENWSDKHQQYGEYIVVNGTGAIYGNGYRYREGGDVSCYILVFILSLLSI
jgi:hypothetical protein